MEKYKRYQEAIKGVTILPAGKLNIVTGKSNYFNIYEDRDSTLEIWKTLGKSGVYKAIMTSGNKPLYKIGSNKDFIHDQNRKFLFSAVLVDYSVVNEKELPGKLAKYGKSLPFYVYK